MILLIFTLSLWGMVASIWMGDPKSLAIFGLLCISGMFFARRRT